MITLFYNDYAGHYTFSDPATKNACASWDDSPYEALRSYLTDSYTHSTTSHSTFHYNEYKILATFDSLSLNTINEYHELFI